MYTLCSTKFINIPTKMLFPFPPFALPSFSLSLSILVRHYELK